MREKLYGLNDFHDVEWIETRNFCNAQTVLNVVFGLNDFHDVEWIETTNDIIFNT